MRHMQQHTLDKEYKDEAYEAAYTGQKEYRDEAYAAAYVGQEVQR